MPGLQPHYHADQRFRSESEALNTGTWSVGQGFTTVSLQPGRHLVRVLNQTQRHARLNTQWMDYVKRVRMCDTGLPDRACPAAGALAIS
jgi:hypothetical protein